MSSYQFLKVRNSSSCSSSSYIRHGFSKSQMCLQKILQIIASYPPNHISPQSSPNHQNRVLDIDLNMEICPWSEADHHNQESESLSACSVVEHNNKIIISNDLAEKSSSEGECDPIIQESEAINLEVVKQEQENEKNQKKQDFLDGRIVVKTNDCFSLLIEAAEIVSGNLKDKEEDKEQETIRDGVVSAVTRSKRGRSHVLPSRYRDSVILEPWKRLPRPQRPPPSPPPPPPPQPIVSTKRVLQNGSRKEQHM